MAAKQKYEPLPRSERGTCDEGDVTRGLRRGYSANLMTLSLTALVSAFIGAMLAVMIQRGIANYSSKEDVAQQRLNYLLSFPLEALKFVPDEKYISESTPESDRAWEELLGPSRGFISLSQPQQQYGLGLGRPVKNDPDSQVYGVTMFHQIHCLIMIRKTYYGLLRGQYDLTAINNASGQNIPHEILHNDHCFDFLQQSIRCAGLMQIELPNENGRMIFDGYGSQHTCKSWGRSASSKTHVHHHHHEATGGHSHADGRVDS
ncbi:riboflavin aldehyde-forming enzyme [Apiospora arundinis]